MTRSFRHPFEGQENKTFDEHRPIDILKEKGKEALDKFRHLMNFGENNNGGYNFGGSGGREPSGGGHGLGSSNLPPPPGYPPVPGEEHRQFLSEVDPLMSRFERKLLGLDRGSDGPRGFGLPFIIPGLGGGFVGGFSSGGLHDDSYVQQNRGGEPRDIFEELEREMFGSMFGGLRSSMGSMDPFDRSEFTTHTFSSNSGGVFDPFGDRGFFQGGGHTGHVDPRFSDGFGTRG